MSAKYYVVSISEQSFFNIVTSALEAYSICHNEEDEESHIPIETYGNLWGYEAFSKREEKVFRVVQADTDTSAVRTPGYVMARREAFQLKEIFVEYYYPELEYLGDFHSHPYDFDNDTVENVLQLERQGLYNFSKGDFKNVKHLRDKENRNYRVGIVTTVYRMQELIKRKDKHVGEDSFSCIRFMHDDIAIWIKAYVFDPKRISDVKVALTCPVLGFHAGSIEQED